MTRYILVSIGSGLLFGTMDAFINANPYAQRLMKIYEPITRRDINAAAGIAIDMIYGFALAGLYLLLLPVLPGESGFLMGLSYGLMLFFLRVFMYVVTQWMMFTIPVMTLLYMLVTGLLEMLVLGVFYGLLL